MCVVASVMGMASERALKKRMFVQRIALIKLYSLLVLVFMSYETSLLAQCNLNYSIGNDTVIGCNASVVLQAPPGLGMYFWNTGATASSITVSQPGTYFCSSTETQASVVVNGDFSMGATGFQSDYVPGYGGPWGLLSYEGTYAVTSNSNLVHTGFANCFDHTLGNSGGSMLVVNGAPFLNQRIWQQVVNVQPNTNYIFSVWGMSVEGSNPGQLNFSINNIPVGSTFSLPGITCQWQNFYTVWNSGSNTTADIAITNQNIQVAGNDFALDDIQFSPYCVYSDTVVVSVAPDPVVSVSADDTICPGDVITLTASSDIPGSSFSWQPGGLSGPQVVVTPGVTTQYTVTATSPQGCTSDPQVVTVVIADNLDVVISGQDSICEGSQVQLTATSSANGTSFSWQPGNLSGGQVTVSPSATTTYIVTATSPSGCAGTDSFEVTVLAAPEVSILGNTPLCEGDSLLLTALSNIQGSSFLWSPGNQATASIQIGPVVATSYTVVATKDGCVSDPETVTVVVNPVPEVWVQDSFVVCPGQAIPVSVTTSATNGSFYWSPGGLTGSQNEITVEETTVFTVYVVAEGCTSPEDTFTVVVSEDCGCEVAVPNVFTPNGDMLNDVLPTLKDGACNFTAYRFSVFNRWGMEVFRTTEPEAVWDGTNGGNSCTEGTYYWILEYAFDKGASIEQKSDKGFVNLFK